MKKSISILIATFVILLSGCTFPEIANVETPMLDAQAEIKACPTCEMAAAEKPACAEQVQNIVYKGSCATNCGFPVTVRIPSDCKGDI